MYLEADNDIKNNNFAEAFRKYESILFEEPANAATHNSLGWLYKTQLDDYEKAEKHYKAALKGNPAYPHAYFNYAILLMDMERFGELDIFLQEALEIETIEKSWIYHRLGLVSELKLAFEEAIMHYERAILVSLNIEKMKAYGEDIERCKEKLELAEKHAAWLAK